MQLTVVALLGLAVVMVQSAGMRLPEQPGARTGALALLTGRPVAFAVL